MRKHSNLSFLERMDIWARKKEQTMKELRDYKEEVQEQQYSYAPKIVNIDFLPSESNFQNCFFFNLIESRVSEVQKTSSKEEEGSQAMVRKI